MSEIENRSQKTEKIESTLLHSKEITEQYGKELTPPSPELSIVTVVPAHDELNNDNFWRMLRSLSIQDSQKSTFEVLYLVNQQRDRLAAIKNVISQKENTSTLQIINELNNCELAKNVDMEIQSALGRLKKMKLSRWEEDVFAMAAKRKVKIQPIFFEHSANDHKGKRFFPQGMARDIGANIALNRLHSVERVNSGIIDFVDADCVFPSDYYSSLQEHANDPYVQKILIPISPDIPESIEKIKDPSERLIQLLKFLKFSFIKARYRYLVPGTTTFIDSAPGLAVQASTFAKVGEYPRATSMFSSEDIEFAQRVRGVSGINENPIKKAPVKLYLSQRETDTSTDGATYRELSRTSKNSNVKREYKAILGNQFFKDFTDLNEMLGEVLVKDRICSEDPRYTRIRAESFKREKIRKHTGIKIFKTILSHLPEDFDGHQVPPSLNERQRDYLTSQPSILSAIAEVYRLANGLRKTPEEFNFYFGISGSDNILNKELAIKFLQKLLPEYFAEPVDNEPDYEIMRQELKSGQNPNDLSYFAYITSALAEYSQHPNSKLVAPIEK